MKYIVQKNDYDCVPVAIYNASRYIYKDKFLLGFWLSWDRILRICKIDRDGTTLANMMLAMSYFALSYERIRSPTIDDLIEHDGPFILSFNEIWEEPRYAEEHVAFFESLLFPINLKAGHMYSPLKMKELDALLQGDNVDTFLLEMRL